jgi:hypothetical protein
MWAQGTLYIELWEERRETKLLHLHPYTQLQLGLGYYTQDFLVWAMELHGCLAVSQRAAQ